VSFHQFPPAVAATDASCASPLPSHPERRARSGDATTVPADAAGRGGNFDLRDEPVPGIAPHKGWHLRVWHDFPSHDRRGHVYYHACNGTDEVLLNTSSWGFTPTQERFAFLVDEGFPKNPQGRDEWPKSPWNDRLIDEAIAMRNARRSVAPGAAALCCYAVLISLVWVAVP